MKMIPGGSRLMVITESSDVALSFKHCVDQFNRGCRRPEEYTGIAQWQNMMKTLGERGIKFGAKAFDEEQDADWVKMRMLGI
jgi:hypothetical protein